MAQIGTNPVFTTTEAIRGALGVDQTDIKDQWIVDAALDVELSLDLSTWLTNYTGKLTPVEPATPEETLLKNAIATYCKWFCALEYARKPLTFTQLYSDGKAEQRRFTNFEWADLINTCYAKAAYFKDMILQLDPDNPDYVPATGYALMGSSVPTYDPVTNEGAA